MAGSVLRHGLQLATSSQARVQLSPHDVQGSDYFTTELARLQRLLEGGKLSPTKLSEISRKISVLGAFQNDKDTTNEE